MLSEHDFTIVHCYLHVLDLGAGVLCYKEAGFLEAGEACKFTIGALKRQTFPNREQVVS